MSSPYTERRDGTFVVIGCGSAKRNPNDDSDLADAVWTPEEHDVEVPYWRAQDLYTSSYFRLKRDYAERMTDWTDRDEDKAWAILSAEYGLVLPDQPIPYYDTNAKDLPNQPPSNDAPDTRPDGNPIKNRADEWAYDVAQNLEAWTQLFAKNSESESRCQRLLILAGDTHYTGPLRKRGAFNGLANISRTSPGLAVEPEFPFNEIDAAGIGEQMGWLSETNKRLTEVAQS
jgi:hypothetical protein